MTPNPLTDSLAVLRLSDGPSAFVLWREVAIPPEIDCP